MTKRAVVHRCFYCPEKQVSFDDLPSGWVKVNDRAVCTQCATMIRVLAAKEGTK